MKKNTVTKATLALLVSINLNQSIHAQFSKNCNNESETIQFSDGSKATLTVGRPDYAKITRWLGLDEIKAKVKVKNNKFKSRWYLFGIKTRVKAKADIFLSGTTIVENDGDKTLTVGKPFSKICSKSDDCVVYDGLAINVGSKPKPVKLKTKGIAANAQVYFNDERISLCATWGKKIKTSFYMDDLYILGSNIINVRLEQLPTFSDKYGSGKYNDETKTYQFYTFDETQSIGSPWVGWDKTLDINSSMINFDCEYSFSLDKNGTSISFKFGDDGQTRKQNNVHIETSNNVGFLTIEEQFIKDNYIVDSVNIVANKERFNTSLAWNEVNKLMIKKSGSDITLLLNGAIIKTYKSNDILLKKWSVGVAGKKTRIKLHSIWFLKR